MIWHAAANRNLGVAYRLAVGIGDFDVPAMDAVDFQR